MIKKEKVILVLLSMLLLNIALASASIEITQPLKNYNFGDSIFTTITLNPSIVSGSFEINLVCENKTANTYKIAPADGAFSANKEQKVNHKITLTKEFIGDLSGNCYIQASIGKESVSSNNFYLSNDITLSTKTDKLSYNPGEKITWSIDAQKINELPLNGYVAVSGMINTEIEVINGKATGSDIIPTNAEAGKYNLTFFAYDKDENGILNQKTSHAYFEVNQIPTKIEISILNFEAIPGEEYQFGVDLFDQSNKKMPGTLSVSYRSQELNEKQFNVESGSAAKINFSTDATPGEYVVTVSKGEIKVEKEFAVKAVPKIDIQFIENSSILTVKNIGNTIYNESLNVNIGSTQTTIPLYLKLGETKKFNLRAPNGAYDITAQSGTATTQRNLLLTGDAISIREGSGLAFFESNPILWAFIVAILLLLGIIIFLKYKKRTFKSEDRYKTIKEATPTLEQVSKKAYMNKQFLDLAQPKVSEAESSISMKGSKNNCSVICLNVKNSLGIEANKKLNEILEDVKLKQGVVDFRSQHILIIFSPLLTKTFNNEILAAKVAFEIKTKLDDYNKRFKEKITYNIGIHAGEMINSLSGGKLSYTSLGNSIILAKRISDLASEKLLVSGTFRKKLLRELKVQKITHQLGDVEVFEVLSIADIAANEEKLKQLLKRTNFS